MASMVLEPMVTMAEVADLLRVSRRTVYTWAQNGRLPAPRKIGRRVLFNRQQVAALLDPPANADRS